MCCLIAPEWQVYLDAFDLVGHLRPENILYRTDDANSDIVIADFGM